VQPADGRDVRLIAQRLSASLAGGPFEQDRSAGDDDDSGFDLLWLRFEQSPQRVSAGPAVGRGQVAEVLTPGVGAGASVS
jgi:hypothetical protein